MFKFTFFIVVLFDNISEMCYNNKYNWILYVFLLIINMD